MTRFGNRAPDFVFTFRESQRERFRSGELAPEWFRRYPELFDKLDLKLARNQPNYHFVEWLGAILLFESTGYRSLVESYVASTHPEKRRELQRIVGTDVADWMIKNDAGLPDLFVYEERTKDWYLCEVKGPRDKIGKRQEECYTEFERFIRKSGIAGVRLRLMELKRIKL